MIFGRMKGYCLIAVLMVFPFIVHDVQGQKLMGKLNTFYLNLIYKSPSSVRLYGVSAIVKADDGTEKTYVADKDTFQSIKFFFDKTYTIGIYKENYSPLNIIVDTHFKEKEGKVKLKQDNVGSSKLYYEMGLVAPLCQLPGPESSDSSQKVRARIYFDPDENEFVLDSAYTIRRRSFPVDKFCSVIIRKPAEEGKYADFNGKIVYGNKKSALVDQGLNLKDSKGTVIQSIKTDVYGDFAFKKVDAKNNFSVVLDKNEKLPPGETVYLSNVNGDVMKEITVDNNNDLAFDLLSTELMKLTEDPDDKNAELLKKFKSGNDTQITITENILYAPAEWQVPPKSFKQLISLVDALGENPNYKIEIYSYTDAVGDAQANMTLSNKRAKAMADLFINKGINKERVMWKGFGETKILNRCMDGVVCPDSENQVNRRTEFKFIKG